VLPTEIDLDTYKHPVGRRLLDELLAWAPTLPQYQTRPEARTILRRSLSGVIALEKAGEIDVIPDGRRTLVTTASIIRKLGRDIVTAYPPEGGIVTRPAVPKAKRKRRRLAPPPPSQLTGLQAANQRRAEKAAARRREEESAVS
jgi:hypothetical protein